MLSWLYEICLTVDAKSSCNSWKHAVMIRMRASSVHCVKQVFPYGRKADGSSHISRSRERLQSMDACVGNLRQYPASGDKKSNRPGPHGAIIWNE